MHEPTGRLGVVGYSARALAEAAAQLGFAVRAIDAFCDQDTRDVADCHRVTLWPHDVVALARSAPCDAWLLAGGMENHGRLVAQLAELGPVLGPTRVQLAQLRSLRFWRELAGSVPGLQMPRSSPTAMGLSGEKHLYKPRKGSGGMYVSDASQGLDNGQLPRGYWQEFIAGRVIGATCLITDSQVRFVGATQSLSAEQWPGPRPYIYRGSLGPVELDAQHRQTLLAMAKRVGDALGLRGYLQADLIEDADHRLWLLELNPRWTAGMEVLHACTGAATDSPLAQHLSAFGIGCAPSATRHLPRPAQLAKAVLYAPCELQLSHEQRSGLQTFRHRQHGISAGWWDVADVPAMGDAATLVVQAGEPLLTVRAGLDACACGAGQAKQTLLAGLTLARITVLQHVFASA